MTDTPKRNGKRNGNGKAGPTDGKRNGKGQFVKGAKPIAGWQPGQSGNPKGYQSLGSLMGQALREQLTSADGKVKMKAIELFARKIVKWSHEESPNKDYTSRQLLAMKAILDRFDPVALKVEHQHSGKVAVSLTPAARAFQEACAEWAHEHDGKVTVQDLRDIRNRMVVSDEDLGIS